MSDDEAEAADDVSVSMEITGRYEEVVSKLKSEQSRPDTLAPLASDVEILLETVQRMGGGTRSAIADELPGEMAADYDAAAVVETMQVLERYDLVVLEGNTWKPGPRLAD
jgi:hypothetical protein